ncbi:MAG TPA: HNH endonuclease signature motif containing protein [Candidatus Limnocylindria bacterium]|nr:HNH endonuclease signature motif containing protein [Candidatus Limnocylindria bacterium]
MAYKDPERQRAYAREWLKRNPEKAREAMRRWRARNPELLREGRRKYRQAARLRDGAKLNAQRAAYLASHPEVKRAKEQAYRARKIAAEGSFTGAEWLELLDRWDNVCAYCGEPGPLEADHRVPLSREGTNFIDNILPACRRCNGRKHKMTEEEFRALLAAERGCDHIVDSRMSALEPLGWVAQLA